MNQSLKVFEIARKGGPPSAPILKRDAANAELIHRLPLTGNGYELKRRGTRDWTYARTKHQVRLELERIRLKTGGAIYVRRRGYSTIRVLRAVEYVLDKTAPCPDPYATGGVLEIWETAQEQTELLELELGRELSFVSLGIFNCRFIDGTKVPSQHAWHNALDGRVSSPGKALDYEATNLLVQRVAPRACQTLWNVPHHYDHAHWTGCPICSGWPPCMA